MYVLFDKLARRILKKNPEYEKLLNYQLKECMHLKCKIIKLEDVEKLGREFSESMMRSFIKNSNGPDIKHIIKKPPVARVLFAMLEIMPSLNKNLYEYGLRKDIDGLAAWDYAKTDADKSNVTKHVEYWNIDPPKLGTLGYVVYAFCEQNLQDCGNTKKLVEVAQKTFAAQGLSKASVTWYVHRWTHQKKCLAIKQTV